MALEKAVQLGMPYSTGQQGLPANLKHIKLEICNQDRDSKREQKPCSQESLLIKRLRRSSSERSSDQIIKVKREDLNLEEEGTEEINQDQSE
jgi:hypothetical protein